MGFPGFFIPKRGKYPGTPRFFAVAWGKWAKAKAIYAGELITPRSQEAIGLALA